MSYKHGVYGVVADTYDAQSVAQGTVPAYIGSAPIHRINTNASPDFKYADYVNKPILITSLRDAKDKGLYSDDWATYTICEAIYAHFMNGVSAVAPIIIVNLLNPAADYDTEATTATITMKKVGKKFVGYIEDPKCRLDNIALTVDESAGVSNQTATYYYDGDRVVIESDVTFSSGKEKTMAFTATATYNRIAFGADKFTVDAVEAAIDSLDYCEQITGMIPNILVAPVISENPELYAIMVQKALNNVAGKWRIICLADIPSDTVKTYEAAKTWKNDNAYDTRYAKVYWPSLGFGSKKFHGSVVGAFMMQYRDTQNSDVPYTSTSNQPIFCDRAIVGDNETLQISEQKANELNAVGITTVNIIKRELRLWGSHMSNYNHGNVESIAPEDRFDASVRMSKFILNHLQREYLDEIDESFTRKDIDSIVNSAQTWLDSLVNDGMLLYATIAFNEESNGDADMANGDFVFDLQVTYTVIAKSITFKLQYTKAGLVLLTTDGGAE